MNKYLLNIPEDEAPRTSLVITFLDTSSATAVATSSDSITATSTCTCTNNTITM
jgi:hypothetical protein